MSSNESLAREASAQPSSPSPEFAVLGLLAMQPAHGYELHIALSQRLGHIWTVRQNQAYNILRRLEQQGLVRATVKRALGHDQRQFKLTPSGRKRFNAWLDAPPRGSVHAVRTEFLTRLYFVTELRPAQVDALIQAQLEQTDVALARLRQELSRAVGEEQWVDRLGIELRVNQLRALRRWLADVRGKAHHVATPKHRAPKTRRESRGL